MGVTVLFDLDDTLIGNDMDPFLRVYLKALSDFIPDVPADLFINNLLSATAKMAANRSPARTLEETFDEAFYPAIGPSKHDLGGRILYFYKHIFPGLHYLTQPRPQAVALIESVFKKGHEVIIATNPLFPKTATQHRLAWAGLPVDRYPFKIVTAYEDFHFAKPSPAYFAEILARAGCWQNGAVMVGNSWEDDIVPAEKMGLPTFWLNGTQPPTPLQRHPLSQTGELSAVSDWIDRITRYAQEPFISRPDTLAAILLATPAIFDFYQRKLPDMAWRTAPEKNAWGLLEIISHLRDTEKEIYSPRVLKQITQENPYFESIDPQAWANERNYSSQNWRSNLQQFTAERLKTLHQLSSLPADDWQRPAHHTEIGHITLLDLVNTIARHDIEHLDQAHQQLKRLDLQAI
ncbi:MAG: HAD hydrolase-like protein [Anaerolineaceae bacterium]|nr:HAD hydrolase-like protein [Anaerolineaceae bacterium]